MNTLRRVVLVFALSALSSVVVACSSSSSGGGGPTTTDTGASPDVVVTDTSTSTTDTASGDASDTATPLGDAGDTWDSYAKGFFAKYCIECHANAKRDYNNLADVVRDSPLIRCGVASKKEPGCGTSSPSPRQFPISNVTGSNPKPTDAERDRIVAWLDAGKP